jgi:hypothetical protein
MVNRTALRRCVAAILLLAAAACCAAWWPHIRNEFFVLLGSRNEPGGWYGFHSGAGGAFYMAAIPTGLILWYKSTCHAGPWCLRWGKYPAAGGVFKLCHRHHPDLQGERPHLDLIHRMHREHKQVRM